MKELHTVVCLKVVPKPEEVKVDQKTMTLDRTNVRSEINPPDMNALEVALRLRDKHGGRVSLLSMGPPVFERYLRVAICVGADHAYLLSDRAFGAADTLATSYTLARALDKIGPFDLVICGEESSDGATAQVPPGLAEWLEIPQITYATDLDIVADEWRVQAQREIKGGHEVLSAPMPAVVSVKLGMNEPRFMDLDRASSFESADVLTVWTSQDLDLDTGRIGLPGSPTIVSGVYQASTGERKREFLRGTPAEEAQALFERIKSYLELEPTP
jgi:electron transfer flavoprotein beta subunit